MVKDWIDNCREPNFEDVFIKRMITLEVRGLPLHTWSEKNLKMISSSIGEWGWWINRPDTMRCFLPPRICCYTNSLEKVDINNTVLVDGVGFHIKLLEVDNNLVEGGSVLQEDYSRKIPFNIDVEDDSIP